jgi:NSS family neurotransmitter:Na+ symporter
MPLLFVLIVIMCVRSLTLDGASKGLEFLFKPDFSKITWEVILEALGQAAFSLSIGMGALITYGSYIRDDNNLSRTAVQVSIADTLIAILAGVMIFPAVFALNMDPQAGPGLVFQVLPELFMKMPGGYFFSIIFFILLAVAALTSTVSLLEVVVAFASEELKIKRKKATLYGAFAIWIVGIVTTLSFSELSEAKLFNLTIFDLLEYIAANILLPLGALFIVIFLGWYLGKKVVTEELSNKGALKIRLIGLFMFIIRYIAPIGITLIFLYNLGLLNF